MLIGLFANWWGNLAKLTTGFANLFLKFRPLTTEQAAQQAIARLSAQSYDIQAQSAAILAGKIGDLTQAMIVQQRVAAGAMGLTPSQVAAAAAAGGAGISGTPTTTTPSGNTAVDTAGKHAAPVAVNEQAAANEAVQKSAEAASKSQENLANAVKEGAAETAAAEDPLKTYNERTYDLGDATEHAAVNEEG
jgi:hypothetical protein